MIIEKLMSRGKMRVSGNVVRYPKWDYNHVPISSFPWTPSEYKGPSEDILGSHGIGLSEFSSPHIQIGSLISYLGDQGEEDELLQWTGFKPVDSDGGISDAVRNNEAFWTNIRALFSNWQFVSSAQPSIKGENPVTHVNLRGKCETFLPNGGYHRPFYCDDGSQGAFSAQDPSLYTQDPQGYVTFSLTEGSGELSYVHGGKKNLPYPYQNRYPLYNGYHFCKDMIKQAGSGNTYYHPEGADGDTVNRTETTDFSATIDDDTRVVTQIRYTTSTWYQDNTYNVYRHSSYRVTIDLSWVFTPLSGYVLGTKINTGTLASFVAKFHFDCLFNNYKRDDPPSGWIPSSTQPGSYDYTDSTGVYLCHYSSYDYVGDGGYGIDGMLRRGVENLGPFQDLGSYKSLRHFSRVVRNDLVNIYPAVYYSSSDAVDEHLERLSANHLENLSQLGAMRDLIEPVQGFAKLAKAVGRKDPVATVMATLDLLATAELLWSYGIAPTLSDAQELADRGGELRAKYSAGDIFRPHTFNGKFTFDLPDDRYTPFTGLKLVARSKVRGKVNPNSFLAALMPYEAFGLLPTLSSMWDLLPFSFVADWFLNIGSRLEDIDTVVKCLAMDIEYSVHSTSIFWEIDGELLDLSAIQPIGDPLQFLYYVRSVSQRVPLLAYSEIDFRQARGVPSWKTAAALVFKLFS